MVRQFMHHRRTEARLADDSVRTERSSREGGRLSEKVGDAVAPPSAPPDTSSGSMLSDQGSDPKHLTKESMSAGHLAGVALTQCAVAKLSRLPMPMELTLRPSGSPYRSGLFKP